MILQLALNLKLFAEAVVLESEFGGSGLSW